jgi:hypothetical protein
MLDSLVDSIKSAFGAVKNWASEAMGGIAEYTTKLRKAFLRMVLPAYDASQSPWTVSNFLARAFDAAGLYDAADAKDLAPPVSSPAPKAVVPEVAPGAVVPWHEDPRRAVPGGTVMNAHDGRTSVNAPTTIFNVFNTLTPSSAGGYYS